MSFFNAAFGQAAPGMFGKGFTSPLASDFTNNYVQNIAQTMVPSVGEAALGSSPRSGLPVPGAIKPSDGGVLIGDGVNDPENDKFFMDMMKEYMSPEYQARQDQRAAKRERRQLNEAMQADFIGDLANKAGEGARLVGGVYNQAAANISNTLAGTRLPSPAIQSGGVIANVGARKYFG